MHRVSVARLQDCAQIVGQWAGGRRDNVIDVAPLLRPRIAEQMRGDHAVWPAGCIAVLLNQLAADVGVQLAVERLDLGPEALDFCLKLLGRHVVLRAPQRAGVGKAQFARALVAQLGQANVIAAHGLAYRVPAGPQRRQFLGIAAVRHLDADFVDAQAVFRIGIRTVPAAPVSGVQFRGLLHGLGAQLWVLRRSQGNAELKQLQFANRIRRERQAVEALGLADQFRLPRNKPVAGLGQQLNRVVGDVGLFDPPGAG